MPATEAVRQARLNPLLLDEVTLLADYGDLRAGQTGTIIDFLPDGTYEVEFVDERGARAVALEREQFGIFDWKLVGEYAQATCA